LSGDILLFAATRSTLGWVEGEATKITEFLICLRVDPKLSKMLRPRLRWPRKDGQLPISHSAKQKASFHEDFGAKARS
jgi:hypothetical protein